MATAVTTTSGAGDSVVPIHESVTLSSGAIMPMIGFGTWHGGDAAEQKKVAESVHVALQAGYRSIDCADMYGNEKAIGDVLTRWIVDDTATELKSEQLHRSTLFVTSKVFPTNYSAASVRESALRSIANLRVKYLDLLLLHWPVALQTPPVVDGKMKFAKVPMSETWKAMEALVDDGLVKSIGISNFPVPSILDLLTYCKIPPVVNQIELHPYLSQKGLLTFMAEHKIHATAYSPLGRPGQHKAGAPLLDDAVLVALGKKYGVSSAVIALRWAICRGTSVIPKSSNDERLKENLKALTVPLTATDFAMIDGLNIDRRYVNLRLWGESPFVFGPAGVSIME